MRRFKYFIAPIALFCLILLPFIAVGGAVAAPIVAVNEFFKSIGDLFDTSKIDDDVEFLIDAYLESEDGKELIRDKYRVIINEETLEETESEIIPLHWLVIPNALAGIENPTDTQIKNQIDYVEESNYDLTKYLDILRTHSPWSTEFNGISTTTIKAYVDNYSYYLGQEDGLDIGDLKEHEFLYPLATKAVVTSEFGYRGSLDTSAGTTGTKHTGIDLAYNGGDSKTCGIPIYAVQDGEVTKTDATVDQAGANWGAIAFENLEVWYLHMQYPFPYAVGDKVKKGDFVGYIGSTGLSTGCHLHLEFQVDGEPVEPRNFLDFD